MTPNDRDTLHGLVAAVVDDTATESQVADLMRWLEHDAEARIFYIRYLDMHAHLAGGPGLRLGAPRRRLPWAAVIAGGLLAASVVGAWLVLSAVDRVDSDPAGLQRTEPLIAVEPTVRAYVATVTSAGAETILNDSVVSPGMRLATGRFDLSAGAVEVRFDGGARVLFEGDSRFVLVSRRAVAIERGTFVFQGDQTCEPIAITTPHSVFKDIGTRYAAVIDGRGEEVHVADGAVRRTVGSEGDPSHELITAGVGRWYGAEGRTAAPIPLNSMLLERSLSSPSVASVDGTPTVFDAFETSEKQISGSSSGGGWSGEWVAHKTFHELPLVSPGLAGPRSVAVLHDATGKPTVGRRTAAHRRLVEPIDLSRDGIWYLRFLMRRGPAIDGDEHLGMVVLRTYGLTVDEEIEQKTTVKIALQREDGAIVRFADRVSRTSLPQLPGEIYAVVAKIVAGRTNPDQVFLRIVAADRLAETPEPVDWSVASESIDTDMVLDQMSLEFVSSGKIEVGDLCIGPTWESVAQPLGRSRGKDGVIDMSSLKESGSEKP